MSTYAWSCLACRARNLPAHDACQERGCPARATMAQIEAARQGANGSDELSSGSISVRQSAGWALLAFGGFVALCAPDELLQFAGVGLALLGIFLLTRLYAA